MNLVPRSFAKSAARLALPRQTAAAMQIHTASDAAAKASTEPTISSDVYAPEEHKYDHDGREDRFPSTVNVPEGESFPKDVSCVLG